MKLLEIALVTLAVVILSLLVYFRLTFRIGCPYCHQVHGIERTQRPLVVRRVLFFLPVQAFVCYSCMRRFLRFKSN